MIDSLTIDVNDRSIRTVEVRQGPAGAPGDQGPQGPPGDSPPPLELTQVPVSGLSGPSLNNVPLTLSGISTPAFSGQLVPSTSNNPAFAPNWSTSGTHVPAASGLWGRVFGWGWRPQATRTLNDIAPPAGYIATGSQSTASQVSVWNGASWTIYWLYDLNDGNPATARWVDAVDSEMADMGGTVIATSSYIFCNHRLPGREFGLFVGGMGQVWQESPITLRRWHFWIFSNGIQICDLITDATSPITATDWTTDPDIVGSPVFTSSIVTTPANPVPTAIGKTAIVSHSDGTFSEWVALTLLIWAPRTAGIIQRADGDWYRQTLAADGTAQYDLLPNQ